MTTTLDVVLRSEATKDLHSEGTESMTRADPSVAPLPQGDTLTD